MEALARRSELRGQPGVTRKHGKHREAAVVGPEQRLRGNGKSGGQPGFRGWRSLVQSLDLLCQPHPPPRLKMRITGREGWPIMPWLLMASVS